VGTTHVIAYTIVLNVTVKITESYINYVPPVDCCAAVRRLLATVPEKYLVGLDSVVLCNLSGQSRKVRTGTLPRRGRRIRREDVAGLYHQEWHGEKAWIQVFVDKVEIPPRSLRWIRPLQDLMFGGVLYHELGHHIHTLRPEYREKEDVADNWATRFSINHVRRRYWYLYPALWIAAKVGKVFGLFKKKQTSAA
jgi:hypothetical protein